MKKLTCGICGKEFFNNKFRKHIEKIHKLNFEDYLREYHKELGGYCGVCGKPTKLKRLSHGFFQFCSSECGNIGSKEKRKETMIKKYGVEHSGQSPEIQEKMKQTCLEKYGVENPAQSPEIQEKMKQTCLEKYGVEHALQNDIFKEKSKQTNIERYGVHYQSQLPEIQEKMKQTCLEKYGVENPSQSPIIQKKMKQTMIERYGVECALQNNDFMEKSKQTCMKHYGVEHPLQKNEFKEKNRLTCLERYGVENIFQLKEIQEKTKYSSIPRWFSLHEEVCKRLDIVILESPEEWYHKELELGIKIHKFHCKFHNLDFEAEWFADRNLCPECRKAMYSKGEREVGDYIETLGISIERNDRIQIGPKEIDIWIPSRNIGIEYNGSYWHKDQSRDQEKKLLCESKGIRLFTVWDTEWNKNKEGVKEYLKKILM